MNETTIAAIHMAEDNVFENFIIQSFVNLFNNDKATIKDIADMFKNDIISNHSGNVKLISLTSKIHRKANKQNKGKGIRELVPQIIKNNDGPMNRKEINDALMQRNLDAKTGLDGYLKRLVDLNVIKPIGRNPIRWGIMNKDEETNEM